MANTRHHAPYPIMHVLDLAIDALLCGSAGWLTVPQGGTTNISWRERPSCYRIAIDIRAGHALDGAYCREWLGEIEEKIATIPVQDNG